MKHLPSIEEEVKKLDYVHTEWGDCVHVGDAIKLLTQRQHAIGEMILEWAESAIKKYERIRKSSLGSYEMTVAGSKRDAFTDLQTFIKKELMNE